jgi:hypothetical protein
VRCERALKARVVGVFVIEIGAGCVVGCEMWLGSILDNWDERQAKQDDRNKPTDPIAIGASLAFPQLRDDASLLDLTECAARHQKLSQDFYASQGDRTIEYILEGDVLSFSSDITTETKSNNVVFARIYEPRNSRGAIIILPHWNATMWEYQVFSRHLKRLGFTIVELTLPYHGDRNRTDGIVADYFLSANLGRTIRSVRQAVLDTRRIIDWLFQHNHRQIGIIGISLGSCLAGIVAAHDVRVRRSALVLTAGDFAEVVWTGRATQQIKTAVAKSLTLEQLRAVWGIISTGNFAGQLSRQGLECLVISGRRDNVVRPYLTERFIEELEAASARYSWRVLGCGHYSIAMFPFNACAFLTLASFFRRGG